MKIRSITYFCNPGWPLDEKKLRAAGTFLAEAKVNFEEAGYEVQTTRLATIPFPLLLGTDKVFETPQLAAKLSQLLPELGIAYAALGPAVPAIPDSYRVLPNAIAIAKNIFFSGVMADAKRGISLPAVNACADVIVQIARLDPNGFANLNFAALANVPPGAPFFPAAYHDGKEPAFALAMEAADVAVQAFENTETIEAGRDALIATLEENAKTLAKIADILKFKYLVKFGGIDYSLAPFPEETRSLGAAFERMGVPKVGLHGSLAAAAILTDAIDRARFPRAGFSGLMMPVLEDAVLAERAAEGRLTVKDLLLYSAVCGTGLDTVPLAGDVTSGQIAALLLDISALALRLDKPLTARLMPVPGKQAGDMTSFDFGFFANSRVMALKAEPLGKALGGSETFSLQVRHS
ncbi:MAG: DUF711 family protein [Chloroflexi bacterium]|nr:DUF711 family protein [Chloroflexota bacterium]